jgi:DNA/RNA-binding domain of Phe-tRNA-synthetase-like protein
VTVEPRVPVRVDVPDTDLVVGLVEARGATIAPSSPALAAEVDRAVAARGSVPWPPEATRAAVRDLLRRGGYKPTGRGKPASEYLAQAAARGEFPRISNAVDALNLVSLDRGLPISVIDLDLALADGVPGLVIRRGREDETYVFNAAGHSIDVAGLLSVAREAGRCIANAVKDSMDTKLRPESRSLLAVLWGTRSAFADDAMLEACEVLAGHYERECGATTSVRLLFGG